MKGMSKTSRVKVCITLAAELVADIDAEVERDPELTRSALIERLLRLGAQQRTARRLAEATADYYARVTSEERAEDEEWAAFSAAAFAGRAREAGPAALPPPRRRRDARSRR